MILHWKDPSHVYSNCEKCWRVDPDSPFNMHAHHKEAFIEREKAGNLDSFDWWLCDDCLLKYQW